MIKHPKGLTTLFFTEMWERFSFYGMRALLTLYLTIELFKDLQEPDKKATAYGIYAAYGALVYATPFIGGLIADKFLGNKKSIIWGAILMAIGHFVMAFETQFFLYLALAFLILGNGFFKPNISSIVGELYDKNDPRRDGGFTIFYMGVNLGAFLAPLVCGTIGELYGWNYGFGLAGVGMLVGLVTFKRGEKNLNYTEHISESNHHFTTEREYKPLGEPPHPERLKKKIVGFFTVEHLIYTLSLCAVALIAFFVSHFEMMSYILTPFAIAVVGILLVIAFRSPKIERERLFVVLILLLFTTLFWAFFEQAGSSLNLFANENVDRNLFGWQIPTSIFQSVNPLFILILASPMSMLWLWLAARKREPSTPAKFGFGILFLSVGFLLLAIAPAFVSDITVGVEKGAGVWQMQAAAVPMIFLVLSYFWQTVGELCLSPIGLSMVTRLASPKIVAMVMGAWFLSSAMAHHAGGIIAQATAEEVSSTELMWNALEVAIPDSVTKQPSKEFLVRHKAALQSGLNAGFDAILMQGDHIQAGALAHEQFNKTAILDSTLRVLHKEGVTADVRNEPAFEAALQKSFDTGINQLILAGDTASKTAIEKEYIDKQQSQKYSLTTRHSLANLLQYSKVFWAVGLIALFASILLFGLSPLIHRMMHEKK